VIRERYRVAVPFTHYEYVLLDNVWLT